MLAVGDKLAGQQNAHRRWGRVIPLFGLRGFAPGSHYSGPARGCRPLRSRPSAVNFRGLLLREFMFARWRAHMFSLPPSTPAGTQRSSVSRPLDGCPGGRLAERSHEDNEG
jgi:hypothetical protein